MIYKVVFWRQFSTEKIIEINGATISLFNSDDFFEQASLATIKKMNLS